MALPRAEAQNLAALLTLFAEPLRARILSALLATEEVPSPPGPGRRQES